MGRKRTQTKKKQVIPKKILKQPTSPRLPDKGIDEDADYGGMNMESFKKNLGCGG
jgi:hypothetical protein